MAASANPSGNQDGGAGGGGGAAGNPSNGTAAAGNGSGPGQGLKHNPGLAMEWTQEEQTILEDGLAKFASDPNLLRYAKIAMELQEKTVRDVALRCRWMTERATDSSAKPTAHLAARPSAPQYALPMLPVDNDDDISYRVGSLKRVSKRFGGDDKMPTSKLKLIPDDNCGMRTVGLVARLMGLETMPVVYQEKPRKALDSEMCGNGKIDSRPQKIHKTGGFLERQPVNAARFSSDAFRFNKSMLAGSKKQHHKLPTPVKSLRTLPRRSTVRLMEAATKILDSGSHAWNCALTYIGSSRACGVQGANAGSFSRNSKDSPVLKQMLVSKPGPKPRSLRQNPLPMAKDKAISVAKITSKQDGRRYPNEVNVAKSPVSSSKNLNKSTVSRPAKVLADSHKMVVMDRNVGGKQLIRKRRPTGDSQSENLVLVNSKSPQERSAKGVCNNRKASGVTSHHYISRNCIKSQLKKRGDGDSSSVGKDNAPMRHGSSSSLHKVIGEKSRSGDKHTSGLFYSKTVSPDAKNGSLASQRATTPLRGDAPSSLLEQKIKELTYLDMNECFNILEALVEEMVVDLRRC